MNPSLLALLESPLSLPSQDNQESENAILSQPKISDEQAAQIKKALIRQISYSGLGTLNRCERRFYLDKLTVSVGDSTISTAFGRAVGTAVQTLWKTGSLHRAKASAFFAWDVDFADTKDSSKQSIGYALKAIEAFVPFYELLRQEWELAEIDGKQAVEYSLLVEFPNGFRYRAYVDLILRHKETGAFCIVELKIDGGTWGHEAKYRNSDQGISYALVLDHIAPDLASVSYWVKYFVFYSKLEQWVPYDFPKSLLDKARWIKTTLKDIDRIKVCEKEDYWPMRGQSCMDFGKPCRYFETCQLQDRALLASPSSLQEKLEIEQNREYSFKIPLEKILENYLQETSE